MVRALVLGAGAAGERHGRALRGLADRCALVGVHDPDLEAARATAKALDVPAQTTEQYPRGLGPTVPELARRLPVRPDKVAFSSCAVPAMR